VIVEVDGAPRSWGRSALAVCVQDRADLNAPRLGPDSLTNGCRAPQDSLAVSPAPQNVRGALTEQNGALQPSNHREEVRPERPVQKPPWSGERPVPLCRSPTPEHEQARL